MKKYIFRVFTLLFLGASTISFAQASREQSYQEAVKLYEQGLYAEAYGRFSQLDRESPDMMCKGYECLCAARLKSEGYIDLVYKYVVTYPFSALTPQVYFQYGKILFDQEDYENAARQFDNVGAGRLSGSDESEFAFKRAYCDYATGNNTLARSRFTALTTGKDNPHTAPACFALGYMSYQEMDFEQAKSWFERSFISKEYELSSLYYIIDCDFMMKNYDEVISNGTNSLEYFPQDQASHIRRLLSESYLVKGDATTARKYYDVNHYGHNSRSDLFFAGSLMYAVGDWAGAVENFSKMTERTDSIGQIANYNLGYSYIQTKNKVAAMRSFKDASTYGPDADIKEDAYFNYAKLAFDLNNDGAVFQDYISRYPSKKSPDSIYSYMAVAALRNKDYAAAVEAFDKIDELNPNMRSNYMKTNYLRASQLIEDGSYRAAIPCLKSAAYYADKKGGLYTLSRFWLAESYFRSADYSSARDVFTDLWNNSAFEGTPKGYYVPFSLGYCYFKDGAYKQAVKWFDKYIATGDTTWRQSALVRKADCDFVQKKYKEAVAGYEKAYDESKNPDDVYTYYQAGLCYGLMGNDSKKVMALQPVKQASADARFYSEALYELGRAYVSVKRVDAAADCFNKLLDSAKDTTYMARSLIELGMIARNRMHDGEAIDYYKSVVALLPVSTYAEDALAALESIYQSKADPQSYLEYLAEIGMTSYKTDEEKEQMLFNAAEQIYLSGDWQKAIASLESFIGSYPDGKLVPKAYFYMADSYKSLGQKELACDFYRRVMLSDDESYLELSTLNYASLSFSLQEYAVAYEAYESLLKNAKIPSNKTLARQGMMRSAFKARLFDKAIAAAEDVKNEVGREGELAREADWTIAKSYLMTSRRDKALPLLYPLSEDMDSVYGAEAMYLLVKDAFDNGEFEQAKELVFKFSDSGTEQRYWLAKSFIVLGDCYAEKGDNRQALATYKSILEGYETPDGKDDDVVDAVKERIAKIEKK